MQIIASMNHHLLMVLPLFSNERMSASFHIRLMLLTSYCCLFLICTTPIVWLLCFGNFFSIFVHSYVVCDHFIIIKFDHHHHDDDEYLTTTKKIWWNKTDKSIGNAINLIFCFKNLEKNCQIFFQFFLWPFFDCICNQW